MIEAAGREAVVQLISLAGALLDAHHSQYAASAVYLVVDEVQLLVRVVLVELQLEVHRLVTLEGPRVVHAAAPLYVEGPAGRLAGE